MPEKFKFYGQEKMGRPSQLHTVTVCPELSDVCLKVIDLKAVGQGADERGPYVEVESAPVYIDLSAGEARRLALRLLECADYAERFWEMVDRDLG